MPHSAPAMYFFISLPIDNRASAMALLTHLRKNDLPFFKLNVPISSWSSFGAMIELSEQLDALSRQVFELFCKLVAVDRDMVKSPSFVKNVDLSNKVEDFCWPLDKYPRATLGKLLKVFTDELEVIRRNFEKRSASYVKGKNRMEEMRRRKSGSLKEIDLANVVGEEEDFEFLDYYYVLMDRDRAIDAHFDDLVYVKDIAGDSEHRLVQFLGIKSKREETEKRLAEMNCLLKHHVDNDHDVDQMAIDFTVMEKGYFTFIDTYLLESFDLLLCVKLTKLYVDSVLQYGLPNSYIFLGSKEKSMDRVVRKWAKALKHFDFGSRSVNYDEFDEKIAFNLVEEVLVGSKK